MRRRIGLLLLGLGLLGGGLALNPGVAVAETVICGFNAPPARCAGTPGDDELYGSQGGDRMYGRGGNDDIFASYGNDRLFGGFGIDLLYGGPGTDRFDGGPGNDQAHADDGEVDLIDCGTGARDEVWFDRGRDVVENCEVQHPV